MKTIVIRPESAALPSRLNALRPRGWIPALRLSVLLLLGILPLAAQMRNLNFNADQQSVEAARYLYRIEGDAPAAKQKLLGLVSGSANQEIQSQSLYLLGRILDQQGQRDSAVDAYKKSLAGRGLQTAEKLWLYRRLNQLSPSSVAPMTVDAPAKSGPARAFADHSNGRTVYTLEFRGPPDSQWERTKDIGLQDANGDYLPLDLHLTGHEEILDADKDHCLVLDEETHTVTLRSLKDGSILASQASGKAETGGLVPGDPNGFLLAGGGSLRVYASGKILWEAPLNQDGCAWIPAHGQSRGILQCGENRLFLVDIRLNSVKPIPGISDRALQVAWGGEFLAIRYIDRFEIRSGPGFETVRWGLPSPLQEKLVLGGSHVFQINARGSIKAYQLETGQLEWQKEMLISQLGVFDDVIFATTFAQTVVCMDLHGKVNWTYEYGWDREPALLPNEDWLVLHYADGQRIKLNRELLRVTGNANSFKFMDYRARESDHDWKGELNALTRILSLEPGNGEAWRLRASALHSLGASKSEQVLPLIEASRSQDTPPWSSTPVLKSLGASLGANWVWKRQFGPKFYPSLVLRKENAFYLENDNQTLVVLNHESGDLVNSFHFSEELDMKVGLWKNDTLCVSSPSRLYFLSPALNAGGLSQFPLRNPVCQAQAVNNGVVFSDWYGNLNMVGLPDRTVRWERHLGQSGLLIGKSKSADYLDVLDLEGNYFAVNPNSGKVLWSLRMPAGTITETFSNRDFIYAGYNQGTLVCIDRTRQAPAWTLDIGEQIFSLSGNKDNTLVVTTAGKKLICVQAATGTILSQIRIQSYLFNRPTVIDHGYWLGTTEPALEKRNFNHELIMKYKLPDLPGSPVQFGNSVFIGTLDDFILSFPS